MTFPIRKIGMLKMPKIAMLSTSEIFFFGLAIYQSPYKQAVLIGMCEKKAGIKPAVAGHPSCESRDPSYFLRILCPTSYSASHFIFCNTAFCFSTLSFLK